MKNSLLSIVMVSYNHGFYLEEAIQSVISQTYKNWELIIVDDGSNDNSLEIAAGYTQKFPNQIKLFTHPDKRNLGIAASYDLGLSLCQGEFIGFLEPDDIWAGSNAQIKINLLLSQNVSLVYSNVEPMGDLETINMRRSCLRVFLTAPVNVPFEAFPRLLVINFVPSFSAAIVEKGVLQNLKFISDRKYSIWLDWFFWIQISLKTKFLFTPQKLVKWRLYKNSYCNQFILKKGKIKLIIFEIKYRYMFFRELILPYKGNIWEKLKMLYLFYVAYVERVILFFYNIIVNIIGSR